MAERSRWSRWVRWVLLASLVVSTVVAAGFVVAEPQKKAAAGAAQSAATAGKTAGSGEAIVARLNKDEISYKELAEECIARRGPEVLETMISKLLVMQACNERGIKITAKEIDDEIGRTAERLKMTREHYLRVLHTERGISEQRYVNELVWPGLALRKIAKPLVRVTEADVQASFEAHYGEKMKCRWIVLADAYTADKVWNDLQASDADGDGKIDLKEFERHVTRSSNHEGSRSLGGQIQPIARHTGPAFKEVEKAAFALRADGEISSVVPYGDSFVILYRESHIKPVDVKLETVRRQIEDEIYDLKLSDQMRQVFLEIQKNAEIERYLGGADATAKTATNKSNTAKSSGNSATSPDAQKTTAKKPASKPDAAGNEPIPAARVNGEVITFKALADEVIARKGPEVLDALLSKRLIRQACQKKDITVSAEEIDAEINRHAQRLNKTRAEYEKLVREESEIPFEIFAQERIWATIAMRKLAAPNVKISDDDVRRGFEATFGDKMKCRWITCSELKTATDVWNRLRDSANADGKIEVAEFERQVTRWSTDTSTRALGGQLQPINRHTSPTFRVLEEAAFNLKENGEISKVIQVMDTYAILYREEHLPASDTKLDDVREELIAKLREAKIAEEMSRIFRDLQQNASIENLLTGNISTPDKTNATTAKAASTKNEPRQTIATQDPAKKPLPPKRK